MREDQHECQQMIEILEKVSDQIRKVENAHCGSIPVIEGDYYTTPVSQMKAKAMTVEKVIEEREKSELKDLKKQIELLTMIMKSATVGPGKAKGREGISSPR